MSKNKTKKRIWPKVLLIILAVILVVTGIAAIHVVRILKDPASFFKKSERTSETTYEDTLIEPVFTIPDETSPDDTEPEAPVTAVEDEEIEKEKPYDVINILLMGIDAFSDGSTSSGTMPHTDVNMVITVNFEKNTVDLISLQRDYFTTVPGYEGFYKFNGIFNVGGGMDNKEKGFELVCRAAEQWLDGISIPYYYAVDFEAVINLVDAIGGVDYDVDQPFYAHGGGTYYEKGMHHLDGKAVLGYLRIRRSADGLDKSRNTRQRKMMIAIFNKLKEQNLIEKIPDIISAVSGGIYTNTTLSQTAALLNYAKNIGVSNINSRAVTGTIKMRYDWAFAFVDQQERVDLIKEVYGITAQKVGVCTESFEIWLHDTGFDAIKHVKQAEKVITFINEQKQNGVEFTDDQIASYVDCYRSYAQMSKTLDTIMENLKKFYISDTLDTEQIKEFEKEYAQILKIQKNTLKPKVENLANLCGYKGKLKFTVNKNSWEEDPDINEIYVDFR